MMRGNPTLEGAAVSLWRTPTVGRQGGPRDREDVERRGQTVELADQVKAWPTPEQIAAMRDRTAAGVSNLNETAENWPTPDTQNSRDGETMREEAQGKHAVSLHHAVATWATPSARDSDKWHYRGADSGHQQNLSGQAHHYSPPAQEDQEPPTTSNGAPSSPSAPSSRRRLNPLFTSWLMGWPTFWGSPMPIADRGYASREMESWRSRSRSLLRSLLGASVGT